MVRSQALFGVAIFMLGASVASTSFAGMITAFSMVPAMFVFEATSLTDIVVSIVAISASKKYGPKSLIASSVLSGLNSVLRAVALTMMIFFLFSGLRSSVTGQNATQNEDESRTQYNLPSDKFPSFAPGSDRPPRTHGPGGPGDCPPLPADLPPFPGPGELPPLPGDVPPFPGGPGGPSRPGHCGPGFPGGPGRPGHPGGPGRHEGQDPREDNEQERGQDGQQEHARDQHEGPRHGREENTRDESDRRDQHEGPRHGRDEETERETDQQQSVRGQQARGRPSPGYIERIAPYFAFGVACWALGLNIAIFVLSVVHTRRVMTQSKSSTTTTMNGKVYSELSSKV